MTTTKYISFFPLLLLLLVAPTTLLGLNTDGVLLLSFKYSILSDPLLVLQTWNYDDASPCSWRGVTCAPLGLPGTPDMFRVTSLALPNCKLLGSIPPDLGYLEHLKHLDLSNNFLNGTLPASIFVNSTELQVLSLSRNEISGGLPESIGSMKGLQSLNLSDNALAGKVPENLATLKNLSVVSLRDNYFSGPVPEGFTSLQVLDLSSNLLNDSLPVDLGGGNLRYLNLSYNKLSGPISPLFGAKIPDNATIDLSFNNLTGAIPESVSLVKQKTESFRGNIDLCGKPLKNPCSIPSTLSTPPNVSSIPPAIAVIPKPSDSSDPDQPNSSSSNSLQGQSKKGLKPSTIVTIVVADLAGLAILGIVILYVYQLRKKRAIEDTIVVTSPYNGIPPKKEQMQPKVAETIVSNPETEQRKPITWSCLPMKGEETSEATSSDSDDQTNEQLQHVSNGVQPNNFQFQVEATQHQQKGGGKLVIVDGETELELETLLKASAYILGSSTGGSIVYKAVLEDGTAFAVRRIGDGGVERIKDFENQVRNLAKLKHQNLVKVRGFYWGDDEKLVICDYVSNGSLSSFCYRKPGSSPFHLPLEVRFKIARGLARGLAFIHDKKHIHGNIKPSNILLTSDMEPVISDFGLDRLLFGNNSNKASGSGRIFGSQRSNQAAGDHPITSSPYAAPSTSSASSLVYQAPESLKNIKPNPKWDVYSFGVILLELLTGRVLSERELGQWTTGSVLEDKNRVLRLVDVAVRADVEAKEDAILACFKLGFSCASFLPQKRPSMKESLQVIEKLPSYY